MNAKLNHSNTFTHTHARIGIQWIKHRQAIAVICLFPVSKFFFWFCFHSIIFTVSKCDFERERDLWLICQSCVGPQKRANVIQTKPNQATWFIYESFWNFYNCSRKYNVAEICWREKNVKNLKVIANQMRSLECPW